jgi:hypothetical protein
MLIGKRNKKVAIKHGCEGARELILAWLARVRIGFTSWRTVPLLFSSCLARRGALDRDAQEPFCYASMRRKIRVHDHLMLERYNLQAHDPACLEERDHQSRQGGEIG